jgi:hypothetical protein
MKLNPRQEGVIFALGFGIMVIAMTIGSLEILRRRAVMLSQADTMNCFYHRNQDESC